MVQAIFNNQALAMLPKVNGLIAEAKPFEMNQMKHLALREISNSKTPLTEMSPNEIDLLSDEIIRMFKYKGLFPEALHD